jgi:MFS family permease
MSFFKADPASREVLKNRQLQIFLGLRLLTMLTFQMQGVAIGWQVYDITNDALALGYVGLAQFVPAFLLTPFTGHAADRFQRRIVLICSISLMLVCALALLALSLQGMQDVGPVYAILVLFGVARAFGGPAQQSILPLLVPREQFPTAVAWSSSAFQTAVIVGPALGGLIFGLGAELVYGAGVAFLALSVLGLLIMKPPVQATSTGAVDLDHLLGGFRFVWSKKIIFGAISLDLFAVLFGGATALLPIFARDILHVGPWGLGLLRCAPAVGAVVTALWIAYRPLGGKSGRTMFICVALFGLFTILFGLSESFWLSMAALAGLGAADSVSMIIRQTLVQMETPDAMRGRVSAVNLVFIGASNELGEFESGLTAAWFGAVPAVVLGGVGTMLVVALWAWKFPDLRKADRLDGVG